MCVTVSACFTYLLVRVQKRITQRVGRSQRASPAPIPSHRRVSAAALAATNAADAARRTRPPAPQQRRVLAALAGARLRSSF